MFRKILKASPLLLLLCSPAFGLLITSPVIRDHVDLDGLAAGDDHTQYQKESEKDQPNGYAGLDGSGDLPASALPVHKDTHATGGSDSFITTDLLEGAVKRIQTSDGPTILQMGSITEGQALIRTGSTLVGSPRIAQNLFLSVRNESGSTIVKGKLVAVTGFNVTEGLPTVVLADKDDSGKRPAIGIVTVDLLNNTNTDVLLSVGTLENIDTSLFSVNDQLVLGSAGVLSRPPPDVDPFTGEIQLIGSVTRDHASLGSVFVTLSSGLQPTTAAQFFATKEITSTGLATGGEVTRVSGLNVAVALGEGFVNDGTELFRVTWAADPSLTLTANTTNFIFVDSAGVVTDSTSMPSLDTNIFLADAVTDGTTVILLANHNILVQQRANKEHIYAEDVIGNVAVSGITTTKDAIALRLQVDAGTFYTHDFKVTVPATDPITFTYWNRDGVGGWDKTASSTLIDKDNWDDGTGTLNSLIATEWKKDLLFVVFTASGVVEYHVFYGQETFASQGAAEAGALPAAATDVVSNGVRSGGVVIEGADTVITSVVDVRPFLGQLSPGTTSVSDHGLLSGLSDDDHIQYLLTTGARAMAGALDMGTNAITNVGLVDGVDVSAHAARHTSGADDIQSATAAQKGLATATQISKLDGIESSAKDDQSAAEVPFTPTGGIVATDTQAAVAEVDSEAEKTANKNAVSGYAGLDGSSKLTGSQQTYGTATNTAAEGNDARIPTTGENDALQGTTGTPSNTNRYVTDEDNRVDIHWALKTAGEGSFEVFAGTPDIKSPNWDSTDFMGYLEVIGGAADDKGGVVYEFIIPEGVTALTEVRCTGKLGTVSQDVINMRVKREDATQIASGTITAATETELTLSSFSPSPTLTAGTRIVVEFEYQGDSTEDGFLGSCRIKMAR